MRDERTLNRSSLIAPRSSLNGWIILDNPSGITSAYAVAKVKRLLKPDKIGHAGTLDPLASGILPLALGEATKTVNYLMDASKSYAFTVNWGAETETDDLEGKVTQSSNKRPKKEEIEAILPQFTGNIEQTPPNYSAIKVDGKRAYDLARSGEEVELKARTVRVDSLSVIPAKAGIYIPETVVMDPRLRGNDELTDKTTFICHCGKGTYIRSIARDIGRQLGCYGHVTMLRRLKVGKFTEICAISLEKLDEMVHKGDLGFLQPVTSALDDIPAVSVTNREAASLMRGQTVNLPSQKDESVVSVLSDGKLIAIGEVTSGVLKSRRIFNL